MNAIVIGCGRIGSELAHSLFRRGDKVVVVDLDAAAFGNLPADFRGRTLRGDVLNPDVLQRAGIEEADALAAVTPSDTVNAVVAHTARVIFDVSNIAVRNFDPNRRVLHEAFGLQVISPSAWGAQRIEELLSIDALTAVFSAGNGEVEVYELGIPEHWRGRQVQELIPDACRAVALTRAGRAVLPAPDALMELGDVLHVSATQDGIEAIQLRLKQERGD